jgi:hypothetical protein
MSEEMEIEDGLGPLATPEVIAETANDVIRIVADRWLEFPVEIHNMRTPESRIRPLTSKSPSTTRRERYHVTVDKRPWHDGDEIIIVDQSAKRQIEWEFPRRDGQISSTERRRHIKQNWEEWMKQCMSNGRTQRSHTTQIRRMSRKSS